MKIAIIIEKKIEDGGGFQQAVNAILMTSKLGGHDFVVFSNQKENVQILKNLNVNFINYSFSWFQKIINQLMRSFLGYRILSKLFKLNYFEKLIKKYSVDFVYFVNPSYSALDCVVTPYGFTVWDLCHLEHPEFVEVREHLEFEKREDLFSKVLPKASFVIADSLIGKKILIDRYKLRDSKVLVQYFSPSYFVSSVEPDKSILNQYCLEEDYYFYPAQFWSHKNHKLIVKAAKKIVKSHDNIKFVFAGSNKGNYEKLHRWVLDNKLDNIIFLGFVPNEHLSTLYYYSKALIMPSFFGPSNIPPLEAFLFNRPILYTFPDFLDEVLPEYEFKYGIDFYDENILVDKILFLETMKVVRNKNKFKLASDNLSLVLNEINYKLIK